MQAPKSHHKLLLTLLLATVNFCANAQQADSTTYYPDKIYYWGGAHIGFGSYIIDIGLDAGMLIRNKFVVGLKTSTYGNIHFSRAAGQSLDAYDYSLLLGYKLTHERFSNWILLSGVSFIRLEERGDFISSGYGLFASDNYSPNQFYNGVGVPVIIKYSISPAPVVAMDFSGGVNINAHRSYFSLTFSVALGKLRSGAADPKQRTSLDRRLSPFFRHQKNLDI